MIKGPPMTVSPTMTVYYCYPRWIMCISGESGNHLSHFFLFDICTYTSFSVSPSFNISFFSFIINMTKNKFDVSILKTSVMKQFNETI